MSKIYIVCGYTGEYSDRIDWTVCAYYEKALAEQHVLAADKHAKTVFAMAKDMRYRDAMSKNPNPFDPRMQMDYTGTAYGIEETEIFIDQKTWP